MVHQMALSCNQNISQTLDSMQVLKRALATWDEKKGFRYCQKSEIVTL